MNLIIDIGNTRAKVLAFEDDRMVRHFTTNHQLDGVEEFSRETGCQKGIFATTARMTEQGKRVKT